MENDKLKWCPSLYNLHSPVTLCMSFCLCVQQALKQKSGWG